MAWEDILSGAGYRVTAPRRAVMSVLSDADVPLVPQEVFDRGRAFHRGLGLVTVYRTLELFEELSLARRVHLKEGCHGYMASSPGHRHVLLCRNCGRSVEFPGRDDLTSLVRRLEDRTGYEVDEHLLQLFGYCPSCQSAASAAA